MPKNMLPVRCTVLVVEDDPLLRKVAVDMLQGAGISVLEAGTADAAWNILQSEPGIDTLFTDINMPGSMDGLDLAGRVAERWPKIRLVVTSAGHGLCDDDMPAYGRFLMKPYRRTQLLKAVAVTA